MEFLDRKEEFARLDELSRPGLAVLWGRRRVGKTRLLVEWSRKQHALYTVADQSAEAVQRRYFAEAVAERVPGFADVTYPDWRALLRAVSRAAATGGLDCPVILDELPYLVASAPSLPSVLQNWLDHEARAAGLLVIVAGSSQRMMQGLVLDAAAPLYGRAQAAFALEPLPAGYIGQGLKLANPVDAVRAYAVWGGIPRYWELASSYGAALLESVDALVLDPSSALHGEPDRLLLEEQPPAQALRPILDAIGLGAHRLSEIAGRIGQPATSLTRPLGRLVEMGLVHRDQPFGEPEKSGKRALYRIADPFFHFWFRVVAAHRGILAVASKKTRGEIWSRASTAVFSQTWEELCRRAVARLDVARGQEPWGPATRFWRGNGPEWDVVSASVDNSRLLLGEAKWSPEPVGEEGLRAIYAELTRKGAPALSHAKGLQVVHAVFVPKCEPRAKRGKHPFLVFDAADVLAALR